MEILPNLGKAAFMFMSKKDLPIYGKALAWMIVFAVGAASFWLICDELSKLWD